MDTLEHPGSKQPAQLLASLSLTLDADAKDLRDKHRLNAWDLGPLLQGALMEKVSPALAAQLHQLPFNPYSQYCCPAGERLAWTVSALSPEAHDGIIQPLSKAESIHIRKLGLELKVLDGQQALLSRADLTAMIHKCSARRHKLQIMTPASFKRSGAYQILPDLHLLLQNLLMHYSQVYEGSKEADQETVGYLAEHVKIVQYSLSSRSFKLADASIPAFMGNLTLDVGGPAPMAGLVAMLLRFATYSGIGIKTAMGMGGIRLLEA
jgi:CRISPR-associated endoribonuclease Cas6